MVRLLGITLFTAIAMIGCGKGADTKPAPSPATPAKTCQANTGSLKNYCNSFTVVACSTSEIRDGENQPIDGVSDAGSVCVSAGLLKTCNVSGATHAAACGAIGDSAGCTGARYQDWKDKETADDTPCLWK